MILFEDEHLLVVNKPPGWNTHAPSPHSGEGIYDWLRHREPRWESLAIVQRLDKETSGVIVFAKSPLANQSLTRQFTEREVKKRYVLVTDRRLPKQEFRADSLLVRAGERYVSRPASGGSSTAITHFREMDASAGHYSVVAEPLTGRTHQIRVHAAHHGFPILGDTLYGGTPSTRLHLHAEEIRFQHPANDEEVVLKAPVDFSTSPSVALRAAFIDSRDTNAFRLLHGTADRAPGWYLESYGEFLLSQADGDLTREQHRTLEALLSQGPWTAAYHKILSRQVRGAAPRQISPRLVRGRASPRRFEIRENGLRYLTSFLEGYSVGLFLDQRDNRRRMAANHIAAGFPWFNGSRPEVLNTFAYTCAFSVCAAKAGASVTSIDLSKKYLEWGKANFALNGLRAEDHDFIFGDVFNWMSRLERKGRRFDLIILDPPTFSQSDEQGPFRAEKDYPRLVQLAAALLKPSAVLFASTNAASLKPEKFVEGVTVGLGRSGRKVLRQHYAPQPPDFPITRDEPAHLKTLWTRVT